jgi:hypothetical protein
VILAFILTLTATGAGLARPGHAAPVARPLAQQDPAAGESEHSANPPADNSQSTTPRAATPISWGAPVYTSSAQQSPSNANDTNLDSEWRSVGIPASLAYDLSSVPSDQRQQLLVVWYNNSYAYSTAHGPHYNNLGAYAIEGNTAPGGTLPTDGWQGLGVAVAGNTLHSRQHTISFSGYNWIRLIISASDGSNLNWDASLSSFDVYDATTPVSDDWVFYGDSITAAGLATNSVGGTPPFAALINKVDSSRWPIAENGGEPFDKAAEAVVRILGPAGYLALFPGTYVALNYGMNDAAGADTTSFYANMRQLIEGVLAAGKVPVIPTIGYTRESNHNSHIGAFNQQIQRLYSEYPQVVPGPDLWAYYQAHQDLIRAGDIHPTDAGYAAYRQLWADTMLANVYGGSARVKTPRFLISQD